jgi:hypothetical protein
VRGFGFPVESKRFVQYAEDGRMYFVTEIVLQNFDHTSRVRLYSKDRGPVELKARASAEKCDLSF